jgi:hypothetical protein
MASGLGNGIERAASEVRQDQERRKQAAQRQDRIATHKDVKRRI